MICRIGSLLLVIISCLLIANRSLCLGGADAFEYDGREMPCVIRSSCPVPPGVDRFGMGRFLGFSFGEKIAKWSGLAVTNMWPQKGLVIRKPLKEVYEGFKSACFSYDQKRMRLFRVELRRKIQEHESAKNVMDCVKRIAEDFSRRYDTEFHKEVPSYDVHLDDASLRCIYRFVNVDKDYPIEIALLKGREGRMLYVSVQSAAVLRLSNDSGAKENTSTFESVPSVTVEVDI